jgi:hemolysin
MKCFPRSLISLGIMTCCAASNAMPLSSSQTDSIADRLQSSTPYFQVQCHLTDTNSAIPTDCQYALLNLTHLDPAARSTYTIALLGMGVESPYLLITRPHDLNKREIYLLDAPLNTGELADSELDYIESRVVNDLSKNTRVRRSATAGNAPKIMEFVIHRRFNVERQNKGNVTLKYKVRYYSHSPFYATSGDKDKYVEVVLAEGSGVDMGMSDSWSDIYRRWNSNSNTSYVYNEYLDTIDVDIQVNDKAKLQSGQIYLNDLYPRMQDQVESKIDKETSTNIKIGLGAISPKFPIQDIEYSFTDKYSITNKKQFGLVTKTRPDGYNIRYENNKYGSQLDPEHGFCNLGTADGWCWDYDERRGNPWNFDKLRSNNSLALSGLRPDFVAKIAAKPSTSGISTIDLTTTVKSLALFGHNRFIIGRRYSSGSELWTSNTSANSNWKEDRNYEQLTYQDSFPITVDWNSPWFLGADSVTIQSTYLSQESPKCLTVVNNVEEQSDSLAFTDCIKGAKSQSFVFDAAHRYRSVANTEQCLDTANGVLTLSNDCSAYYAKNTQIWSWQEPNNFANDVLFTINNDRTINAIDASTTPPSILTVNDNGSMPDSTIYTSQFSDFSQVNP